ncbi:MAG: hypothetical protein PHC60_03940 [Heliobacteriaceae bacterium]|nr:hypothetical protein [Heliobacteriaceae bacterium]MDD4587529.1 hypothetical protein [Heliobacteriaceae bacterium]
MRKIKSGNLLPDLMADLRLPLANAEQLNLNTLNVPLRVDVPDPGEAEMQLHPQAFDQVTAALPAVREAGLDVFLEPFPWIQSGGLAETAWQPKKVDIWFEKWGQICLQAAHYAQVHGIGNLVIADGISNLEPYPQNWLGLIQEIRKIYRGKVTYRTQWWYTSRFNPVSLRRFRRKLANPLFGALDFISVSAYFELTNTPDPGEKALVAAWYRSERYQRWQPIFQQVKVLHEHWRKPIFFGELGYVDLAGTGMQPWSVTPSNTTCIQEQQDCFTAFFRVFWHQPWFMGASVFQIHQPASRYYPVNKPAAAVIRQWPQEVTVARWSAGMRTLLNRL